MLFCETQHWDNYDKILIVAMSDGELVGSVCLNNDFNEKESIIHSLYVDEKHRRQGIASLMLSKADEYVKFKVLIYLEDEPPQWLWDYYVKRGYIE